MIYKSKIKKIEFYKGKNKQLQMQITYVKLLS